MKATELITKIQSVVNEYGDLDTLRDDTEHTPVDILLVEPDEIGGILHLIIG